jgi:tRNA pseudouridine55 synthase
MAKKFVCHVPPRIFLVNKPRGAHSGDVLKHFKYHLPKGFGKIGHLGTLDPFAEGLLLVAVGQAARLSFLFESLLSKTYEARGVFHHKSTTGDSDGDLNFTDKCKLPNIDDISKSLSELKGEYLQSPPHFSAAKHNGKALYKYAREGVFIDKPPVKRFIYNLDSFSLLVDDFDKLSFSAEVSSGTYIRTLFEDISSRLGTTGYLEYLKRAKIGSVNISEALSEQNWPERGDDFNTVDSSVCPSHFFNFPKICAENDLLRRIENGQKIPINEVDRELYKADGYVWVFCGEQMLRGLMELTEGVLVPKVIFPKINLNI